MSRTPRVFTIPPSRPFLPTLIDALVGGRLVEGFAPGSDPLALAGATLYLPTRRACRMARDAFLDILGTDAAILPRLVPLGDIDEDGLVLSEWPEAESPAALDIPPALEGYQRRMLLTRLVLDWARRIAPEALAETPLVVPTPAAALALADDLAHLMDDISTRQADWTKLDGLVPDHVDQYWKLTLDFLKIARDHWPDILAERGAIESARRRDLLITAQSRLLASKSDGPVIAAGSTGSMPATARLIETISRLPNGAVVLPGLDTDLDDEAFARIAGATERDDESAGARFGHPQLAMRMLLDRLGLDRSEVAALAPPLPHGRETLASEIMRPADTSEHWPKRLAEPRTAARIATGFNGLSVIEAANPEEEGLAIAIAMREAIADPAKSAILVTPDRALARRVISALGRWGIDAEDTAGVALSETASGVFARLAAEAALDGLAPVQLLALLKHPLAQVGTARERHDRAVATLDLLLRGPRPRPGGRALAHLLATIRAQVDRLRRGEPSDIHRRDPRAHLSRAEFDAAAVLIERLCAAFEPLDQIDRKALLPLSDVAARHREVIFALSVDETELPAAFSGPEGKALAAAFDEITGTDESGLRIAFADYIEMFTRILAETIVRRPERADRRIGIFGMLEARLVHADRVILGGLVEDVWPPQPRTDPWLSRPMRRALGLDLPERRIGLSAHDFAQLLGMPEVVLTRSAKRAGSPTVASRFLTRMTAVGRDHWRAAVERGNRYLCWARHLDHPPGVVPITRPQPRPPVATRPTTLSVTEIEHWLRDPYTIYARHILKLMRWEGVDTPPGHADRGSAIHGAIGDFTRAFAAALPPEPLVQLLDFGRAHFADLADFPEARAFWWPRYERIARWFAAWEAERRDRLAGIGAEIAGALDIAVDGATFRLTARADRIERERGGGLAILDYKTGQPPSEKQVRSGVAPQLTLEAAILRRGGFPGFDAGGSISKLTYVRLRGGEPAGEQCPISFDDISLDEAADQALDRLITLISRFAQEETPYRSLVMPMWKNRYGTYDDLSRIKEWAATAAADEGDE